IAAVVDVLGEVDALARATFLLAVVAAGHALCGDRVALFAWHAVRLRRAARHAAPAATRAAARRRAAAAVPARSRRRSRLLEPPPMIQNRADAPVEPAKMRGAARALETFQLTMSGDSPAAQPAGPLLAHTTEANVFVDVVPPLPPIMNIWSAPASPAWPAEAC